MTSTGVIKYQTIGTSNIRISKVGLGCASAWGQPWFDEKVAIAIGRRALDLGVTVFDTGPSYSRGHAEPRLGKALKGTDTDRLFVSTKVGTHITANGRLYRDFTRNAILSSVESSRRRLGLDLLPLLYLHGPRKEHLNSQLLDTLIEMRERGWVRLLGVNSFDTEILTFLEHFDVVMLDYNVLRHSREPLIAQLSHAGKFVVAGAALANHLYTPSFLWPKRFADVWYSLRALKNHRRDFLPGRRFASLGACRVWTPAQVALSFVLSNSYVGTAMFGTTRLQHLEENIAACDVPLPDRVLEEIRSL